ncbi:hypothetical protein [Streptomyces sp. NPDC005805]|uniref:hypothetical protein n=1 Tax=Streptomyces sp. NPDC005805 TaxID=3157068 RepID=UPI00340DE688
MDEDTGYRRPGREDRTAVAAGVGLLLDGRREQAAERLADVDMEIRTVVDRADGRRYAEVADRSESARSPRGWGRVYVPLDSPARWSVQVPHPRADSGTEKLGVDVLRGAAGGVLVVAGAHREAGRGDASDVAHRRDTVFHAVCAELFRRGLPALQLHGFAPSSVPDHDMVASTGKGDAGRADGRVLADALRERDFTVCRAWVRDCPLEGRSNVQGRAAAAAGTPFLHLELSRAARTREDEGRAALDAIAVLTGEWAARPPRGPQD